MYIFLALRQKSVVYFNTVALSFTHVKQSGAVEACWAHNPEVRGSKPRSAMTFLKTKKQRDVQRIQICDTIRKEVKLKERLSCFPYQ